MIYATLDSEGDRIDTNANIMAFDTREKAVEFLLSAYGAKYWDVANAIIGEGRFGDYWIRTFYPPGNVELEPFTFDQLSIRAPGQHPGGHWWWIEPSPPILIVEEIHALDA